MTDSDACSRTSSSSSSNSQGGSMNEGALRRVVSQRLAESIIQPVASGGPAVPAQRQGSYNQLLRTNTNTDLNRQRLSQTRTAVADDDCAALRFQVGVTIARLGLTALGFWLHWRSKTCATTNEHMYHFIGMYVVFNVVLGVVKTLVQCVAVPLVLFMALDQPGLFGGPGEHRSARQGLINDLETVAYDATLFSDTDPDKESPECCICQGDFEEGGMNIKRVPCCLHHFHKPCLGNWLGRYGKTCPLCRMDLQKVVDERGATATP